MRYDRRQEAEAAIAKLNGVVPVGGVDPITVKFANNPAANTQKSPLQVGQSPEDTRLLQAASALMNPLALLGAQSRRLPGPIHHTPTSRFRYAV